MRARIWLAVTAAALLAGAATAADTPAPQGTATVIYERSPTLIGQKFELNYKPKGSQSISGFTGGGCKKRVLYKNMLFGNQNEATFSIPAGQWLWLDSELKLVLRVCGQHMPGVGGIYAPAGTHLPSSPSRQPATNVRAGRNR